MTQNSLSAAFSLQHGDVISLVGGGGKTTVMLALADELVRQGQKVIVSTTTKIFVPDMPVILGSETAIIAQLPQSGQLVCVGKTIHQQKIIGLEPQFFSLVAAQNLADYILVEADGAKKRPFKAPNEREPLIPANSRVVLSLCGVDVVGKRLNAENCHRPELIAHIAHLHPQQIITAEVVAQVLFSLEGGRKNVPAQACWIPVLNKVDTEHDYANAMAIAAKLQSFGVQQIVLLRANSISPIMEIIGDKND